MSTWQVLCDSLLLRTTSLAALRNKPDIFRLGLLILVAVSLVVGLVSSTMELVSELQAPPPEEAGQQARAGFRQSMTQARTMMNIPPQVERQIEEYFEAGLRIEVAVAALPVRVPQPAGHILKAIGHFLSTPFDWLGAWMFYTLLVAMAAHLMGGKATLQQMLGLTAFYTIPHLLDVVPPLLGLIPLAGPSLQVFSGVVVGGGAWVWGLLVYIAATTVASDFDWARGVLAVLAPVLLLIALVLVAGIGGLLALIL